MSESKEGCHHGQVFHTPRTGGLLHGCELVDHAIRGLIGIPSQQLIGFLILVFGGDLDTPQQPPPLQVSGRLFVVDQRRCRQRSKVIGDDLGILEPSGIGLTIPVFPRLKAVRNRLFIRGALVSGTGNSEVLHVLITCDGHRKDTGLEALVLTVVVLSKTDP